MSNYDVRAKQNFVMPNHFKKFKFLEFGISNANLAKDV